MWTPNSATYYFQNGVAGACGTVHSDYDYIAAIGKKISYTLCISITQYADGNRYGNLGERSGLCGRRVQITNNRNGRVRSNSHETESNLMLSLLHQTVVVTIADACPTCLNSNSIDLSMLAFQQIASLPEGMVPSKLVLPLQLYLLY